MNLLYCDANGIVLATHDDNDAATPMSAYPTAVRIIPYDQPLSTLQRVGQPPPAGQTDTRPYQQPAETPAILTNYAAQARYNRIAAGFTFNAASGSFHVDAARQSWMLIGNMAQYAATVAGTTIIDFNQLGVHHPITATEAGNLFKQFGALQQNCRTIEAQIIADQKLATPTITTYAQVDAMFSSV